MYNIFICKFFVIIIKFTTLVSGNIAPLIKTRNYNDIGMSV